MTSYARLWVLKSDEVVPVGDVLAVSLKNGRTKLVKIGTALGRVGDKFLYLPANQEGD